MSFALRFLQREWRAGDLPLMLFSLTLAVLMVTGISYFSLLLNKHIVEESSRFLSADRVLQSTVEPKAEWRSKAEASGLQFASLWQFSSMLMYGEEMQLSEVNVASGEFPLKGALSISRPSPEDIEAGELGDIIEVGHLPPRGEIWVEVRLLRVLGATIGDELEVGYSTLKITALLHQGAGFGNYFSAGPRVLINAADLAETRLIMPGSRVEYRSLFAGDEATIQEYEEWLKPQLNSSHRWLGLGEVGGNLGRSINRAEQFLLLGAALAVWLSGLAVLVLANKYTQRHVRTVAMLRTLGVSRFKVASLFFSMTSLLVFAAILIGSAFALGIVWPLFLKWVNAEAEFSFQMLSKPLLLGVFTALGTFALAVMPGIWQLANTSPMVLFQQGQNYSRKQGLIPIVLVLLFLPILVAVYTASFKLSLLLVLGLVALFAVVSLLSLLLIYIGKRAGPSMGVSAHLALASLWRNRWQNAGLLFVVSTSLCLMLLAVLMRTSLLAEWQGQMGEGTPNYFVLNLEPQQVAEVEQKLKDNQVETNLIYPMIRGRLVTINDERVTQRVSKEEADDAGVDRELNLSWAEALPVENELVAGQWWEQGESRSVVSVEERLAKRLNIQLGDQLQFRIGGLDLTAEVSSIRKLDWESMRPGFYMIFPPKVLQSYPATFMTSFYLPPDKRAFADQLVREYPNVYLVDVASIVQQVQKIINQVSLMVQLLMACVVVAAMLLVTVSVYTAMVWRLKENALLKAFGSSKRLLNQRVMMEYGALALIAGLVATVGAELITVLLQVRWFNMPWQLHSEAWLLGPALAMVVVLSVVLVFLRRLLAVPVVRVLE